MFFKWACYSIRRRERLDVHRLEAVLSIVDYAFSDRKRRHVIGGVLMSISLLFGGLAITVISLKEDNRDDEQRFDN